MVVRVEMAEAGTATVVAEDPPEMVAEMEVAGKAEGTGAEETAEELVVGRARA